MQKNWVVREGEQIWTPPGQLISLSDRRLSPALTCALDRSLVSEKNSSGPEHGVGGGANGSCRPSALGLTEKHLLQPGTRPGRAAPNQQETGAMTGKRTSLIKEPLLTQKNGTYGKSIAGLGMFRGGRGR